MTQEMINNKKDEADYTVLQLDFSTNCLKLYKYLSFFLNYLLTFNNALPIRTSP
ncbi:hypothetical protein Q8F60_08120 [Streptococcus constellatus]|uniref:Uncharacterized protein n=1 Tax=Streptococcus constellatus subsp. constellatus SK53 TaxID=1095730 RepID=A0AAD2Y452_STRCV|nr:hypothetical protein [Streptococcus constellatus]EID21363.1 hypothetical protein HMPREF1044_1689 [Streptococcus constellatus subsp. constellatus SK53]MDP1486001.1 hypothetical protein [Streptococcus constellatus]QQT05370.1 hypothetical protein I6J13_08290 [Streptococcus constellatus]BBD21940.1 hypothetical protein SCSC_0254 [Streptococcus constellatus subsp. constellatus]GAD39003.1 hypothetical protein ANG2_1331 [Streptococcus constellatus subsp. constellatus SK53]